MGTLSFLFHIMTLCEGEEPVCPLFFMSPYLTHRAIGNYSFCWVNPCTLWWLIPLYVQIQIPSHLSWESAIFNLWRTLVGCPVPAVSHPITSLIRTAHPDLTSGSPLNSKSCTPSPQWLRHPSRKSHLGFTHISWALLSYWDICWDSESPKLKPKTLTYIRSNCFYLCIKKIPELSLYCGLVGL
jgi:hypothetical protein